jgi:hypothetical protein
MSQPPQEPGEPRQEDPRTVPRVEQSESETVPRIPRRQPAFETATVPPAGSRPAQYGPPAYGYPQRRGNTMAWTVLGGGLLVVGMILTLVIVLNSGPDTDTPEGVAQAVAEAFNDHDFEELTTLSCEKDDLADTVEVLTGYGSEFGATAEVDDVDTMGDSAVAELTLTYTAVPDELDGVLAVGDIEDVELGLTARNGAWCVSRFSG